MTRRLRLRLAAMRKPIQFAQKAPKKSEKLLSALSNIEEGTGGAARTLPMAVLALQHLERYVGSIYKGMLAAKKAIEAADGKEKALLKTQADNSYLAMSKHFSTVTDDLSKVYSDFGHLLDVNNEHHLGVMMQLGNKTKAEKATNGFRTLLLSVMRKVNSLHAQAGRVKARRKAKK